MKISVDSNVGKLRKSNQDYADYFVSSHNQFLFILCDGVGGHQAGEVASELTTKFIGEAFTQLSQELNQDNIGQWIDQIIHQVNDYIYTKSIESSLLEGMGTTLIMATLIDNFAYVVHVGDSRAYFYRNEELFQLTQDHSLVNELIRTGEITEEEVSFHPQRNIVTQSIGVTESVTYELQFFDLNQVEYIMLCSDGLTNMLNLQEMTEIFAQGISMDRLGKQLIEAANNAGGKDNISIILVSDFTSPGESEVVSHDRY